MNVRRYRDRAGWLGITAIVVVFSTMGAAMLLSPSFSPRANALSNLGVASHSAGTTTTALLFNGGLILGGLLGVGFGLTLVGSAGGLFERIGAVVYTVSVTAMGAIGVFPQMDPLHFPVAVSFYALFSVAAVVYGVGKGVGGHVRAGAISISLGLLNLGAWIGWGLTGSVLRDGLAIPELVGAGAVAVWTLWAARTVAPTEQTESGTSPMAFGR